MPIQHANVGTVGTVKGTSMIMDYNGTTKTAVLAETLGAAIVAGDYTIPANLTYVLGTLSTAPPLRSEEHTSELQSLMRISYAVFCLKKTKYQNTNTVQVTTSYHPNQACLTA